MQHEDAFTAAWRPKCCEGQGEAQEFCEAGEVLNAGNTAGHACVVNGNSVSDSNFGGTDTECQGVHHGVWTHYDCSAAAAHWSPGMPHEAALTAAWRPKCCGTLAHPPSGCPAQCHVSTCVFLGTDGPGWDSSWARDDDGRPTVNGVCTHFCKDYEAGKYLCGDGAWHRDGVDCTSCANDSPPPPAPAPPSLCSASGMTGHRAWGTGIKQCDAGPAPTSDTVCTVWQGMNGDSVVNPGRTCRSFCSHFGLSCLNGYDDGNNGCTYGGAGIGCDSILGCCSDGGPTPDHVCSCGPTPESELVRACSTSGATLWSIYGNPRFESETEKAGDAVCCHSSGTSRRMVDGACTSGLADDQGTTRKTFADAKQICESKGLRLCADSAELDTGCTTGCMYDHVLAWTQPLNLGRGCGRRRPWAVYGDARTVSPDEVAGDAVCCDASGQSIRKVGGQCTSGKAKQDGRTRKTFAEAKEICEAHSLRLCASSAELSTGCGTGCLYDAVVAWLEPLP